MSNEHTIRILRTLRPITGTAKRPDGLDCLVTCPVCGTTRLVAAVQVRQSGLEDCPTCRNDNEAA